MGIRVFIESKNNSFCEQIAYFKNESDYDVCFKALEKKAKKAMPELVNLIKVVELTLIKF